MDIQNKVCEKYCNRRLANLTEKCPFCFEKCSTIRKGQDETTRFTVICKESKPHLDTTYEQVFEITDGKEDVVLIEEKFNIEKSKPFGGGPIDWRVRDQSYTYTDAKDNSSKIPYPSAFGTIATTSNSTSGMTLKELDAQIARICKSGK